MSMCVECEDTAASVSCMTCDDVYCDLCFQAQHKKGNRAQHPFEPLELRVKENHVPVKDDGDGDRDDDDGDRSSVKNLVEKTSTLSMDERVEKEDDQMIDDKKMMQPQPKKPKNIERLKLIPLRLTLEERGHYQLLDACLNVSEYTDQVDLIHRGMLSRRILKEFQGLFSTFSGLLITRNYSSGMKAISNHTFLENQLAFQSFFEIGRRYKVMNPEQMRNNYGKMIYALQDSSMPNIQSKLQFSCLKTMDTIYSKLETTESLDLMDDPSFDLAIRAITTSARSSNATTIVEQQKREKLDAIDHLSSVYANARISKDEVAACLHSFGDHENFLALNVGPIERMLEYLETYFSPQRCNDKRFSLAIRAGSNGARLSHTHERQYHYVRQTFALWKKVTEHMLELWRCAEEDLLYGEPYRLRDTGQGYHRMQRAPATSRLMHRCLHQVQAADAVSWIGSSVIHMGDRNVPNAFLFIDKYSQISRICQPIVRTIEEIERHFYTTTTSSGGTSSLSTYLQHAFGTREELCLTILSDFFKHGFDGSGADNFFDAGSCIDGRLTSAWNWCSKIEKKAYYPVFLLAGFLGFDGQFNS